MPANTDVGDLLKRLVQVENLARVAWLRLIRVLWRAGPALLTAARRIGETLKEIAGVNVHDSAQFPEFARADSVCAALVFLDLLKTNIEPLGKLLLRHAAHFATLAHAATNVRVDWMWHFETSPASLSADRLHYDPCLVENYYVDKLLAYEYRAINTHSIKSCRIKRARGDDL